MPDFDWPEPPRGIFAKAEFGVALLSYVEQIHDMYFDFHAHIPSVAFNMSLDYLTKLTYNMVQQILPNGGRVPTWRIDDQYSGGLYFYGSGTHSNFSLRLFIDVEETDPTPLYSWELHYCEVLLCEGQAQQSNDVGQMLERFMAYRTLVFDAVV